MAKVPTATYAKRLVQDLEVMMADVDERMSSNHYKMNALDDETRALRRERRKLEEAINHILYVFPEPQA